MVKRPRLSISFKQQYWHVYEHLKTVPNKSEYISKAVESYMGKDQTVHTREEIRLIVMDILQKQGGMQSIPNEHLTTQTEEISKEDTELINQLF